MRNRFTLALGCIYLLAVVVYGVLATRVQLPTLIYDELIYGNLSQALAAGDGATWRGASTGIHALLYPLVLAPAWIAATGVDAYSLAKLLNVLVACATAVPVWLIGRSVVNERLALIPAALTLAGSWMEITGKLLTENLALPLTVGCFAALVLGMIAVGDKTSPSSKLIWAALGLALMAAFTRIQMVALIAVIPAALLLDVAVQQGGERAARLRAYRFPLAVTGGLLAVGATALVLAGGDLLGRFAVTTSFRPGVGDLFKWNLYYMAGLVLMTGVIPVIVTGGLALARTSWRDPRIGPLLSVTVAATVIMVSVAAWFTVGTVGWLIERYIVYVAPLFLIGLVASYGRLRLIQTMAASGVAVGLMLLNPTTKQDIEARGFQSTTDRLSALGTAFETHPGIARALLGIGLAAVAIALMAQGRSKSDEMGATEHPSGSRSTPLVGLFIVVTLTAAILGAQAQWSWQHAYEFADGQIARADLNPKNFDAVGRITNKPVSMLFADLAQPANVYTAEFFNPNINSAYAFSSAKVPLQTKVCRVSSRDDGLIAAEHCPAPKSTVLIFSLAPSRYTLENETVLADFGERNGRLVTVKGQPRFLASVTPKRCPPPTPCIGTTVVARLNHSGLLKLTFDGGPKAARIVYRGVTYTIAARRQVDIRIPLRPGRHKVQLPSIFDDPVSTPILISAEIKQASKSKAARIF